MPFRFSFLYAMGRKYRSFELNVSDERLQLISLFHVNFCMCWELGSLVVNADRSCFKQDW